jgi:hypothetical protein
VPCIPVREIVLHYFSGSGGTGTDLTKEHATSCYADLCFFYSVGSTCHVVHSSASRSEASMRYFSCSGGASMDSTRNAPGHVTPNLCFCIRWDLRVT